jgi:hypothetical protein
MNHEMTPGSGESDPTKEITSLQINELCLKIIDVTGGMNSIAEHQEGDLHMEAHYYQDLDQDGQPYETVYSVYERTVDAERTDGTYYYAKSYQIVFDENADGAQFAEVESYYEMHDEEEGEIVRAEHDNPGITPQERLQAAVDAHEDKRQLGLNRPLNQQDYLRLKQLLALLQR